MGKALIVVLGVVVFVYAFFDLIATPSRQTRFLPKPLWFVALLLVPVGPLAWIFFGQRRQKPGGSTPPRTSGWGPPAKGPDDDPDYLRGL